MVPLLIFGTSRKWNAISGFTVKKHVNIKLLEKSVIYKSECVGFRVGHKISFLLPEVPINDL